MKGLAGFFYYAVGPVGLGHTTGGDGAISVDLAGRGGTIAASPGRRCWDIRESTTASMRGVRSPFNWRSWVAAVATTAATAVSVVCSASRTEFIPLIRAIPRATSAAIHTVAADAHARNPA